MANRGATITTTAVDIKTLDLDLTAGERYFIRNTETNTIFYAVAATAPDVATYEDALPLPDTEPGFLTVPTDGVFMWTESGTARIVVDEA